MAPAKRKRASTSSSPRRRKKSNNQGGKKFVFYAALLVVGAGAIVFYDHYISPLPLLSTQPQKAVASKTVPKRAFAEPDYQFYTLLPKGDGTQKTVAATTATTKPVAAPKPATTAAPVVASTAQSATPVATTSPAATTTPTATATPIAKTQAPITVAKPIPPSHHYAVQLAAFRNYQDADELKAKLILQGYPTTISSASVNGTVWYRLSIGPYNTPAEAKTVQAKLEQTHLVNHTQVIQQ